MHQKNTGLNVLFLVTAPFNITCIQEAVKQFCISYAHIITVYSANDRSHQQLVKKISQLTDVHVKTTFLDYETVAQASLEKRIALYANHIHLLQQEHFNMVFFSEFRSQWQQDIIETLNHPNTWMLDDGAITLPFLQYHWPSRQIFSIPQTGTNERIAEARNIKSSLGIKKNKLEKIKIFTIFSHITPNDDAIIPNQLSHLKKNFEALDSETDLIIGAKLIGKEFMSYKEYEIFIRGIINNCNGSIILYAPHRGQPSEMTQCLIERNPELTLLKSDQPIEDWLKVQAVPPARIHGYCSTAFYIFNLIYPQLSLHCYTVGNMYLDKFDLIPTWGSTLFKNSDALRLQLDFMPESVKRIIL